jgi:hypothetical protein
MKKTILVLGILLVTFNSNAQWFSNKTIKGNGNVVTKTRTTNDYDTINVSGFFDVTIIKGNEGKIKIKAESNLLDYIITEVYGDVLIIKLKEEINLKTKKGVYITVPINDLKKLSLNGSGDIISNETILVKNIDVNLSGSGDINLVLTAKKISSKITGSGNINLSGKADFIKVKIVGSGDFSSKKLKSKRVEVNIIGSGDATVFASDEIEAKVAGSGDIIFYGNPKNEYTKIIGSGDIEGR